MLPGTLKDKIGIYTQSTVKNDNNERVKSYSLGFSVRTETSYVSGGEGMHGQMGSANKTMKFKVRFHMTRFTETQVILFRGDYYNIRSIDPDRNRKWLILTADRQPPDTITIV